MLSAINYWIQPGSPVACDLQSAVMQIFEVCAAFTWTCLFQVSAPTLFSHQPLPIAAAYMDLPLLTSGYASLRQW